MKATDEHHGKRANHGHIFHLSTLGCFTTFFFHFSTFGDSQWNNNHMSRLNRIKLQMKLSVNTDNNDSGFITSQNKWSVSSATSDLFCSLVSLLWVTSTRTWMIHWEKNESTSGYMFSLPASDCCISLCPTQETWMKSHTRSHPLTLNPLHYI